MHPDRRTLFIIDSFQFIMNNCRYYNNYASEKINWSRFGEIKPYRLFESEGDWTFEPIAAMHNLRSEKALSRDIIKDEHLKSVIVSNSRVTYSFIGGLSLKSGKSSSCLWYPREKVAPDAPYSGETLLKRVPTTNFYHLWLSDDWVCVSKISASFHDSSIVFTSRTPDDLL